ncbi:MAG: Do family serine endopeptidase [Gammaproteobacteria bacterium]|nr:Do family serine endopeptidase [Gammaproteobacteria bacterium]MDH3371493.1 Do family serine endopeptidase [Gammaproteobacteria bacterium]MDH3405505.1 Do family serine endopeptidase [Gammaproteobacteria bacterium]MDH3563551.1 Do family serine endopeptidase [Gammaproteobacteria bacterium]MDH5486744.1 Do family serine endopeptidase [Gammaproteobacteria bacterium]
MSLRQTLTYLVQAVVLGLAIAFVVLYVWPEITGQEPSKVEIRQTAPELAAQSVGGPNSYATAVDRASSAVVNINTAKVITVRPHPFFDDPIFRQFFGGADNLITPRKRVETSLGSGVIMSAQGIILTNHHVIRGADAIQVSLQDGRMVQAKVVGSDPETDIAVLKIDLKKLPVITLGHSDKLRVGDVVLAIGNPFGVGQTVTMGIVSATGRNKLGINTFENFIQTDAAINPGNSGGALIDAEGNLVGINTAIFSRSGGNQGIGFAIPTSLAQNVMEEIIKHGRPQRGWLGIEAQVITPQIARALELKDTKGVVVVGVVRGGPAHKAGLQPGDVLVSIDGKKINEAREALLNISSHKPGSVVKLGILREGKSMMLQATAIERPTRTAATE